ncbi:MAG: radical SAM protein [Longimicrobiales bacterium]|nr:radical SAM protein [Longimicrobiales bacterium]
MTKSLPVLGVDDLAGAPSPARPDGGGSSDVPSVDLRSLDQLWFQVSGTVCNLRCRHCFISCSPENHSFWFMSRCEVRTALETSRRLGVKEYYFTGGEPFMNREMPGILEDTLAMGPATVLTNATLLPERMVDRLAALAEASMYSLELRVSIDGVTAEMNDAIRGEGTFRRAMDAVGRLAAAGFLPIVTTMQTWEDEETDEVLAAFRESLADVGYRRARLKILPPLRIGEEAQRSRAYRDVERVTPEMMRDYPQELLLCSSARLVTAAGVWVCPILLDDPEARAGATLSEAVRVPARLHAQACYTCWAHGAICSNASDGTRDFT